MSTNAGRLSDAVERLLPFLIVVGIVTFAFFWFLQTPLNAYLRARTDTEALQARLATAREGLARLPAAPPVDMQASMREFDRQMAPDDKVADVTSMLARAVLDSAPADKLRGFAIETSDRVTANEQSAGTPQRATAGAVATGPDARLSLFPVAVTYTPVKVTFASTFEAIASFMWKVRDLPTTVEVKSATLTRGLPLMKMELLIWVYQRGAAVSQEPGTAPGAPGTPAAPPVTPAPVGPRVAQLMSAER